MSTQELLKALAEMECTVKMDGNNIIITPCKEEVKNFKDGDIIAHISGTVAILKGDFDNNFDDHCNLNCHGSVVLYGQKWTSCTQNWSLAAEEQKQKLFDALKRDNKR